MCLAFSITSSSSVYVYINYVFCSLLVSRVSMRRMDAALQLVLLPALGQPQKNSRTQITINLNRQPILCCLRCGVHSAAAYADCSRQITGNTILAGTVTGTCPTSHATAPAMSGNDPKPSMGMRLSCGCNCSAPLAIPDPADRPPSMTT